MLWTLLEGEQFSRGSGSLPDSSVPCHLAGGVHTSPSESVPAMSVEGCLHCKESPVKPMKEKCQCGGVKKVIPYIIRGTNNLRGECSVCEECDSYSYWPRAK